MAPESRRDESRRDAPLRGESQFTAPEPRSGESPKVPELRESRRDAPLRESPKAPESLRDESPCTVPESLRDESRRDAPRSDES